MIPHYGLATPTNALIDMLFSGDNATLHEVIVADDCSPDPFIPADERTILVRRERNGGFGSAVNSGAARATGTHLLVLNSDLTVSPGFVDALATASQAWDAVTGPAVVSPSGAADWTGRRFPTVWHQVAEWLTILARWRETPAWHAAVGHDRRARPGVTTVVDWLVGAALLIPMASFRQIGGFDERFFMNCEEIDLQRRLRDLGVPSVYLGDVTVLHEGGGSSDPALRRRWLVGARFDYARKWGGHRRLIASLTAATAANFAWNLVRRATGSATRPVATAREELSLIATSSSSS